MQDRCGGTAPRRDVATMVGPAQSVAQRAPGAGTYHREARRMKGGKGGQGRKRSTTRTTTSKEKPREGARKGAAKKDWGAIPKDDAPLPAKPSSAPRR